MIESMRRLFALTGALIALHAAAHAADDVYAIAMPGRQDGTPSAVAPDIMTAIVATVRSLRGESDLGNGVAPVSLAPDAKVVAADRLGDAPAFSYEGYAVARARLLWLEPSKYGPKGRRLSGVVQFVNAAALRAEAAFLIDYTESGQAAGNGLAIHQLQTMAVAPTDPRVVLQALPRGAGEVLAKARWNDIGAFMEATLALRKPLPLTEDEWLLVALSPDRMPAGDALEIHVVDKVADKQPPPAAPYAGSSFDIGGFPVAAVPWTASGKPAVANIFVRTDLHPEKTAGRRLVASQPLSGQR
jgi:hypothetical protein